ncbi:MAG TPA: tetratricopeptide repeat protein, partial [Povalibacter sp.]
PRYSSAALLAKDVEHYLALEPVVARPHTLLYVLRKLVRRRWPAVAVAMGVLLMATLFTLRITDERNTAVTARNAADAERRRAEWALIEVAQQRDRARQAEQVARRERDLTLTAEQRTLTELNRAIKAEREAAAAATVARREALTAQKVSDFLESIFMGADPDNVGLQDVSAYSLLVRAREQVSEDLATEPAVRSRMLERLALVHEKIGRPQEAGRIYDEAIEMERRTEPPQPARLSSLLIYAALFKANNKLQGPAEAQARESLALREKHEPLRSHLTAQSLDMLALVISSKGRHEEAIPLMQRALASREFRTGPNPDDQIASSHHNLGVVYRRMGNYARALQHLEIGTAIQRKRLGLEGPRYLNTAEQLGLVLGLAGRTDEALPILRHALETRQRLQGDRSARTALSARELGTVQALAGQHADAVITLRKGLEISRATHGTNSPVYAGITVLLAESLAALAGDSNIREAESLFTEALRIHAENLPANDPWMADAQFSYGRFLLKHARMDQALLHLQDAERIRNVALTPGNPFRSQASLAVAELLLDSGNTPAAKSRLDALMAHRAQMFAQDRTIMAGLDARIDVDR